MTVSRVTGYIAPDGTASTRNITIPPTAPGASLVVAWWTTSGGTRTASGGGGSWGSAFDDSSSRATWVNKSVAPGTTSITLDNGGVNTHFTAVVLEVSGLDPLGSDYNSGTRADGTGTAFVTNTITPLKPAFVLVISQQADGVSPTCSPAGGLTAPTDTGITAGNVPNTNEGDCLFAEYADVAAGPMTGAGTWGGSVTHHSWAVGFDLADADDGTYQLTSDLYF